MLNDSSPADAARLYAAAHALHYSEHDLLAALRAYERIIALHPGTPEAGYARTQIRNIVQSVVPAEELLAAQVDLASRHLLKDDGATTMEDPTRPAQRAP